MPLVSMDASLEPALAKDAWIAFASTSTAKFLPSCFMPASRFVVSVFASTDAEIFWPAAAKPRLMPDASILESFFPRSGASNLVMVAPSLAAFDAASAARCAALSKADWCRP